MTTSGSLCSGYRGLDLAVDTVLNTDTRWVSDIDPSATRLLAHRWPAIPNLGDLTALNWSQVEPVDVLTAGYPCQPFSHAGKRKGENDERHLWPFISEAIGALRPRLVILENVAGHLSLGGPTVIADLASRGYDARWVVVRASDIGACHRRARIFIAAHDAASDAGRLNLRKRQDAADPEGARRERHQRSHPQRGGPDDRHLPTPRTSDAKGPGEHGDGGTDLRTAIASIAHADSDGLTGWEERNSEPEEQAAHHIIRMDAQRRVLWGDYEPAIRRHSRAWGLTPPSPKDHLGRLNPEFVEWMMMVEPGHVTAVPGLSRTKQLHLLGNGVVPPQATAAIDWLLTPERWAA